ncbi:transporter substrate-binding domain-containing protein [Chitinimonas koreensis]|uniref:transporter substrate-binding domain-containing protein n=1 Tax=Chitinimonas koreensis TaxID=356302 RepID=UPI0003F5D45A|nr:transporter substrate-binding domain-containing protein [Chitinimonas koreensis]QNM95758.1 transporter substrate-binding domain-containing protein [Chitinimonas koreensis]
MPARRLLPLLIALAGLAAAQAQADQLDDIRKAKKIRIAIDLNSPPFGSRDAGQKPAGSDVEAAQLLAKDLEVALEIVDTSGPNRIPDLQARKADLVISSLSITPEREKLIDFSAPYGYIGSVIGAPKGTAIAGFPDLAGKRVAAVKGTTNEKYASERAGGAQIVRYDDNDALIAAAVAGKEEVVATSPATVRLINDKAPKAGLEVKFVMMKSPLGIGLRKGEPKLKEWLDGWVAKNKENGKLGEIGKRFHGN